MFKHIISVISFLFISSIFNCHLIAKEKDKVVATVNNEKIMLSELVVHHHNSLKFVQNSKKVTIRQSLDDLINRKLGIQKAKKEKLDKETHVINKMEDILYHAQISKDLEGELLKIRIKDEDIKAYYEKFPEYRTSQILLRIPAVPTEEEVKEAMTKALEIYEEIIVKPSRFEALATKHSQAKSVGQGGDLGFQPKTRYAPEYYEAINGQAVDTVLKPFRTQYGVHIVKITGKKSFNEINKEVYGKIVYDEKRNEVLEKYFSKLQQKANIKIKEDLLSSFK